MKTAHLPFLAMMCALASMTCILLAEQDVPPKESTATGGEHPSAPAAGSEHPQAPKEPASGETPKAAADPSETPVPVPDQAKPKVEDVTPAPEPPPPPPNYQGTVAFLDLKQKFVIIDFKHKNNVPPVRSELGVYRNGRFVGSIRITPPVKPPNASADILQGSLRQGDEVR